MLSEYCMVHWHFYLSQIKLILHSLCVYFCQIQVIQVCQEAAFCALRENINTRKVEQKHFDEALKKVLPQIDMELLKIYEAFSSRR